MIFQSCKTVNTLALLQTVSTAWHNTWSFLWKASNFKEDYFMTIWITFDLHCEISIYICLISAHKINAKHLMNTMLNGVIRFQIYKINIYRTTSAAMWDPRLLTHKLLASCLRVVVCVCTCPPVSCVDYHTCKAVVIKKW